MSVSQVVASSAPLTSNYTICQLFTSQLLTVEHCSGGGGGGDRISPRRPVSAASNMNVRPRWSQQHKHMSLLNRQKAFSRATLAANAFRIFQSLIEFENEDTKSFICLFTDNSFALKRLFPLITI